MNHKPRLRITKKIVLDNRGHYRFYSPLYPSKRQFIVTLNPETEYNKFGEPYPFLNIETEKQLALFLFQHFGEGIYRLFAYLKGRKGLYTFWYGEINPEGWMFFNKEYEKEDLYDIDKEMNNVESEEERLELEELRHVLEEKEKNRTKKRKYGINPFLKNSGRRGSWHTWDENVSKVVGFDILDYYKKLSPSERGGYRRLNRDVKERYVKQMWLLCKKYNIQFNISDPDYKELNESSSCCGLPNSRDKYDSDCVNFSKGQLTHFIVELMKRYLKGERELYLTIDEVLDLVANKWSDEKRYYGDSLKCWNSDVQNKDMNHKLEFMQTWNRVSSPSNPYNYFMGLLTPHHLDANKNIVYKFTPPAYVDKWKKEGIL